MSGGEVAKGVASHQTNRGHTGAMLEGLEAVRREGRHRNISQPGVAKLNVGQA